MNKTLLILIAVVALAACQKKDKEEETTPETWEETTKVSSPHLERITATATGDIVTFMKLTVDGNNDLTSVSYLETGTIYDVVFEKFIKDINGRVKTVTYRPAVATEGTEMVLDYDQKGRIASVSQSTSKIEYLYDAQDRITDCSNSVQKITYHYTGAGKMPDSTVATVFGDPSVYTDVYTYGTGIAPFSTLPQLMLVLQNNQVSYNHIGYDVTGIINKKDGVVTATASYTNTYDAAGKLKTRTAVGMGLTYEYHYVQ